MKNLKTLAIFLLAAAVLSSCGGLNKMVKDSNLVSYSVDPEVLEMHGGEVDAAIKVNYPAKYFNKKAVVTLTPVLRYEGGEKSLDRSMLCMATTMISGMVPWPEWKSAAALACCRWLPPSRR